MQALEIRFGTLSFGDNSIYKSPLLFEIWIFELKILDHRLKYNNRVHNKLDG